jgi:hypothetical protein
VEGEDGDERGVVAIVCAIGVKGVAYTHLNRQRGRCEAERGSDARKRRMDVLASTRKLNCFSFDLLYSYVPHTRLLFLPNIY